MNKPDNVLRLSEGTYVLCWVLYNLIPPRLMESQRMVFGGHVTIVTLTSAPIEYVSNR